MERSRFVLLVDLRPLLQSSMLHDCIQKWHPHLGALRMSAVYACVISLSFFWIPAQSNIFTAGLNTCAFGSQCEGGQLGVGDFVDRPFLQRIENFSGNPIALAAGDHHTIVLSNEEGSTQLFVAGSNQFGQLGLGLGQPGGSPRFFALSLPHVNRVACGGEFTVVLQDVSVVSFGRNQHGQLGVGDFDNRYRLVFASMHVAIFCVPANSVCFADSSQLQCRCL